MHKNIVRSENPGMDDSLTTKEHMENFGGWLLTHLNNDNTVSDELFLLYRGPSSTIWTFQGYEINGNTFYTNKIGRAHV